MTPKFEAEVEALIGNAKAAHGAFDYLIETNQAFDSAAVHDSIMNLYQEAAKMAPVVPLKLQPNFQVCMAVLGHIAVQTAPP